MDQVLSPICARTRIAPRHRQIDATWSVVFAAVAIGIALRVAASQGAPGLDEIWSLKVAGTLPSIGDAFWGLPHDNNHALNTAAMMVLGPGRAFWIYRIPALVFGALTIVAVARTLARKGPVAAAVGAVLAGATLPFVEFGSEARGYGGLVLASVLAIQQWQRAMAAGPRGSESGPGPHGTWGLAAAAGFGAFNHLAMVMSVAVLVVATLVEVGARSRRVGPTLAATARLFAPTAAALLPALLALAVAIHRGGGLRIGDIDPFTPTKLAKGLGDMLSFTVGLPASPLSLLFALVLLACLAAAWRRRLLGSSTVALCAAAFVALPAMLWIAHIPNVGYPRYFAICAVVLVLALAEIAGGLWGFGKHARTWAVLGLGVVLVASLVADWQAIRHGRSAGAETLAIMQASGTPTYATDRPLMAELLLGAAGPSAPAPVAATGTCAERPEWYIAVGVFDSRPSGTVTLGSGACLQTYRTYAPFLSNPLSGTQWTLYRRTAVVPNGTITVLPGSGA